jgi:predicted ATPase/DNA-binding SARP family transcriptional activator
MEVDRLHSALIDPRLGRITVAECWDRWCPTVTNLRPNTTARDAQFFRSHALPTFGRTPIGKLDRTAPRAWVAELGSPDGSNPAPATGHLVVQLLNSKCIEAAFEVQRAARRGVVGSELLEFAVLGPLEVRRDGTVLSLRRGRPRIALSSLVLHVGHAVPADVLIDQLWGDDLPANAANALQVVVSYLRKTLDLAAEGAAPALRTVAGGYLLDVPPDAIDAARFEAAVSDAARRLEQPSGQTTRTALDQLLEALSLWRGEPFQDVADEPFVEAEVQRLHELRATALEQTIEARLALGEHDRAVGLLRQLVADFPLRERFRAQLVLALYRSGRQAEALRTFDGAREQLVDELGIEPGRELQDLHRAVLEQRPELDWTPAPDDDRRQAAGGIAGLGAGPSDEGRHTALPSPTARLVGRASEIERVRAAVVHDRLVTLTGPGGAGKTSLALAVAHAEAEHDPAWLVELGDVAELTVVPFEIARALGVTSSADPLEGVTLHIGHRPGLLVLDTCEHLLDACASVAHGLLRRCPSLHILATSREAFGIAGEVVWPVPPLGVPHHDARFEEVRDSDAVNLFVERARAARRDFELDASNAPAVAAICQRLDGLPLAIELAAARTAVLSPSAILERLDDRFAVLRRPGRAGERRQQSLRATIAWSIDLLEEDQQVFFRRASTFAGRFTLPAACVVAGHGLDSDPLDLLTAMVERSLVVADGDDTYRMLDSLRAYAATALEAQPADRDATFDRLARWMTADATAADARLRGPEQQPTLARLRLQMPNMRAALGWCWSTGDRALGAQLAASLGWYWALEGENQEAVGWLTRALDVAEVDSPIRARLLELAGIHVGVLDVAEARALLQRAVTSWRELGTPELGVLSLVYLGIDERWLGALDSAAARQDEAIALAKSTNDDWNLAWALVWRAGTSVDQGDEARAGELLESSRRHAERAGDPYLLGWIVKDIADAALRVGKVDEALGLIEESIDILEPTGWKQGLAAALTEVGRALVAEGRVAEAVAHHRRALRTATDLGQPTAVADALEGMAEASAAAGDDRHAAELFGSATVVRARMSAPKRSPQSARALDTLAARLRDSLGELGYSQAFARGERLAATEVIALYDAAARAVSDV